MSDPLVDWVKDRLTLLYQRNPDSLDTDLSEILKSTFKDDANLVYNHQPVNVAKFGDDIRASSFAATRADVEWKEIVALPSQGSEGKAQPSIVAGYFVVVRSLKFRIRVGPAQMLQHCFFSVKLEDQPHVEQNQEPDLRRISELFMTSVIKQAPIHLQRIPDPVATPEATTS